VRALKTIGINLNEAGRRHAEKVLIIEDNRTNKVMLTDILMANGYETRAAADGEEGLRIIREWCPAVVLLDIVMPGLSGISVCQEIRKMALERRPAVIAVSIKDDKGTVVDALTNGADDFVSKPVNAAELIARERTIAAAHARRDPQAPSRHEPPRPSLRSPGHRYSRAV